MSRWASSDGYIHADAYPGYDAAYVPDGATEVACWAHARRTFVEAEKSDPELAKPIVEAIGQLYAVERQAKEQNLDADGRLALRQRVSVPLLGGLHAQLGEVEALPKSPLGRAVGYAQSQWQALQVYATNGSLGIDNNPVERALRPFAVGRKNWLFVQNEKGGKRAAILMSLVMTAKAIGLNPTIYLRDLLVRIARESDVAELTPHGWREHFAKQVAAEYEAAVARLTGR